MVSMRAAGCHKGSDALPPLPMGTAAFETSVGFEGVHVRPNVSTHFGEGRVMEPLISTLPVMSVTTIFFAWNVYRHALVEHRHRRLRERVAHMLWAAAEYAH